VALGLFRSAETSADVSGDLAPIISAYLSYAPPFPSIQSGWLLRLASALVNETVDQLNRGALDCESADGVRAATAALAVFAYFVQLYPAPAGTAYSTLLFYQEVMRALRPAPGVRRDSLVAALCELAMRAPDLRPVLQDITAALTA
jgi:hypothetical protein